MHIVNLNVVTVVSILAAITTATAGVADNIDVGNGVPGFRNVERGFHVKTSEKTKAAIKARQDHAAWLVQEHPIPAHDGLGTTTATTSTTSISTVYKTSSHTESVSGINDLMAARAPIVARQVSSPATVTVTVTTTPAYCNAATLPSVASTTVPNSVTPTITGSAGIPVSPGSANVTSGAQNTPPPVPVSTITAGSTSKKPTLTTSNTPTSQSSLTSTSSAAASSSIPATSGPVVPTPKSNRAEKAGRVDWDLIIAGWIVVTMGNAAGALIV